MLASRNTLLIAALLACFTSSAFSQGVFLTGVGGINRSMGGATMAAPIDSMGTLHWNPAAIRGLESSEVAFSAEIMLLDQELTAGGITARDESGVAPIPSIGWVHHLEGTTDTIGLGMYSFAGFGQNMPAVVGHPILDPVGIGALAGTPLGPLYSEAQFFQIVPTFSRAVTDRLSIGFAPTINLGRVEIDPIPFLTPALGAPGAGTRWSWGIGAQVGLYYEQSETTSYGFSIKSPQWFEEFRTHTVAASAPTVSRLKLDLPMIISAGIAYKGLPCWTFALDVRYFDYKNTDGFGKPDINGTELHWDNVFSVAFGAQRKVNDQLTIRGGYTYNTSPIDVATVQFNFASPLIQQHVVGLGASYRFTDNVDFSMSYIQILEADRHGPSPLFGTISNQVATYSLAAGVTVRYGN
ncbi:MAG: outer membrane protein transport protein [Planctomycetes bacterium]|nr:outer membrane protein transport protein [Planctomycetota bacterium]